MEEIDDKQVIKERYRKNASSRNNNSIVDNFSGEHTTSIIVAILFSLVLVCYVSVLCIKQNVDANFNTSMVALLTLLVGFFTGIKTNKR